MRSIATLIREQVEPITDIETSSIGPLLERMSQARIVLLGEATHGSREFYDMRARISRELIERHGFDFVAVEADWPDAARIDNYVIGGNRRSAVEFTPFARFPTWMWRNEEVLRFVQWLRQHNHGITEPSDRVGFHGLDLYSMFTSIAVVLAYLDEVDPPAANVARERYAALVTWQRDPAAYGRAVLAGRHQSSEAVVVENLKQMLRRQIAYMEHDGERFFDATRNAKLVVNAERYYRLMYHGAAVSWNLRDEHMFETLESLLHFYGSHSRGIVWEHNSHVGNALATEMAARGEFNVGQLCRTKYRDMAYIVGFGTDHGTVAAASSWGASMERMPVRPSHPESFERLFHDAGVAAGVLHLREPRHANVRDELSQPRLERAIGVIYRPESELQSHYFRADLARQFDEYIWFDETAAVTPLPPPERQPRELPDTYPFGL